MGQAAWNTFFQDANGFVERSVDKVSDLDTDTTLSVFGKADFQGTGRNIEQNTEKALRRVSNNLALLRRYTSRAGVQEKVQEKVQPRSDPVRNWTCSWHRIRGLATDEVFLVQKIRVRYFAISNQTGLWQGLIVGKPWGPFQWTGDGSRGGISNELYPNEGQQYAGDTIGIHTTQDFHNNTRMNWVLTTDTVDRRAINLEIDLSPNFIPLRSYQIITEAGLQDSDDATVMLEGKSVKWLLPFEQFD